jgi:hypothetical protein
LTWFTAACEQIGILADGSPGGAHLIRASAVRFLTAWIEPISTHLFDDCQTLISPRKGAFSWKIRALHRQRRTPRRCLGLWRLESRGRHNGQPNRMAFIFAIVNLREPCGPQPVSGHRRRGIGNTLEKSGRDRPVNGGNKDNLIGSVRRKLGLFSVGIQVDPRICR